jgi:hypothetical protein
MPTELIVAMEDANREIRRFVGKLSGTDVEFYKAALPPVELQALSRKLGRVAQQLGRVPPVHQKEAALQAAISVYVGNLETLKKVLERVRDSLGKKRDRLKKDFEHISSARAWAEACRATHNT